MHAGRVRSTEEVGYWTLGLNAYDSGRGRARRALGFSQTSLDPVDAAPRAEGERGSLTEPVNHRFLQTRITSGDRGARVWRRGL
jgi:hypothetical protein